MNNKSQQGTEPVKRGAGAADGTQQSAGGGTDQGQEEAIILPDNAGERLAAAFNGIDTGAEHTKEFGREAAAQIDEPAAGSLVEAGRKIFSDDELSERFKGIEEALTGLNELARRFREAIGEASKQAKVSFGAMLELLDLTEEEFKALEPAIREELKPFGDLSLNDVMQEPEPDPKTGEQEKSIFFQAVRRAQAKAQAQAAEKQAKAQAEKANGKNLSYDLMLRDKLNSTIWTKLNTEDQTGVLEYTISTKRRGDKANDHVNTIFTINFDVIQNEETKKQLTEKARRQFQAICSLFAYCNPHPDVEGYHAVRMTSTDIFHAMGYTRYPRPKEVAEMMKANSLFRAEIGIDNTEETSAGYSYPSFTRKDSMLDFIEEDIGTTSFVIYVLRPSILYLYAAGRKQIAPVPIEVLQSPKNKNEQNLRIEDYLITRISQAQNKKQDSVKILFSTVCDHAGITAKSRRSEAKSTVLDYLQHDKTCGYIRDYIADKKGVLITL